MFVRETMDGYRGTMRGTALSCTYFETFVLFGCMSLYQGPRTQPRPTMHKAEISYHLGLARAAPSLSLIYSDSNSPLVLTLLRPSSRLDCNEHHVYPGSFMVACPTNALLPLALRPRLCWNRVHPMVHGTMPSFRPADGTPHLRLLFQTCF